MVWGRGAKGAVGTWFSQDRTERGEVPLPESGTRILSKKDRRWLVEQHLWVGLLGLMEVELLCPQPAVTSIYFGRVGGGAG